MVDELSNGDQFQIFLWKINASLKIDTHLQQLFAQGMQMAGERPLELLQGGTVAGERSSIDYVNDRLCLGEVEATVQEGAFGKLPGFSNACTLRQDRL
jgi:hypothetical protein